MRQIFYCEQCDRLAWRTRSTKSTCSDACRKKRSRGVEPVPYWQIETTADKYEDFVAVVIEANPRLARKLDDIKSKWGLNAMFAAIDSIYISLHGESLQ